jgi:hypothetical protein
MTNLVFSIIKNMVLHSTTTVSQEQENACLEKLDAKIVVPEKATSYSPLKSSEFKNDNKAKNACLNQKFSMNEVQIEYFKTTKNTSLEEDKTENKIESFEAIKPIKFENKVYEPLGCGEPYIPPKPLVLPTPPSASTYISPGNANFQTRVNNNFAYTQACGDYMGSRMKAELAWKPFK